MANKFNTETAAAAVAPAAAAVAPASPMPTAAEKAAAFVSRAKVTLGEAVGVPAGFECYSFFPAEVGPGRARAIEDDLLSRGYEYAPDAYLSGQAGAKVYILPLDAYAILQASRAKRDNGILAAAHHGATPG